MRRFAFEIYGVSCCKLSLWCSFVCFECKFCCSVVKHFSSNSLFFISIQVLGCTWGFQLCTHKHYSVAKHEDDYGSGAVRSSSIVNLFSNNENLTFFLYRRRCKNYHKTSPCYCCFFFLIFVDRGCKSGSFI